MLMLSLKLHPTNLEIFLCPHLYVVGTAGDLQLEAILILRPEAGEYVFISLIANQVLEDKQRICT